MWKELAQRLAAVFGTAGIFLFFSEYGFVNEVPVQNLIGFGQNWDFANLRGVVEIFLFYGFFAYGFLIVLGYFRVATIWTLFLAGAVFGWLTEGVIIPVVYENIPLSFAWTAIGWHAVIDVMVGWYLVRIVLRKNNVLATGALATGIGLFWGYFATWTWASEGEVPTAFAANEFAVFAFLAAFFWIGGLFVLNKWGGTRFVPSRVEIIVVLGASAALAVMMALPALPWSAMLLPIVALTFFALWRAKPADKSTTPLGLMDCRAVTWPNYAVLILTPIAASLTYGVYVATDTGLNVLIVALPLIFGGVAMFALSLVMAIRAGKAEKPTASG
ncbi:MAG: hypothetical protein GXP01_04180 [Alphaproteobacteria bacterium]|nr:hypothetical protein [Alphaproteobacteria bacterium]